MPAMITVTRLVTFADVDGDLDARRMSVSLRLEAVLVDGRSLLLLADRGWTFSLHRASADDLADIWALTSIEDVEDMARVVVGPDEPFDGHSQEDMEAGHWAGIAELLEEQGVHADAAELRRLPHGVVLSERLRARLGHERRND